jgi:hypothetical protein
MWIAFRLVEGDFLLPLPGQCISSAGTKSSIKIWSASAKCPLGYADAYNGSRLPDSKIMMALFKCLSLPMKYKNNEAEREYL